MMTIGRREGEEKMGKRQRRLGRGGEMIREMIYFSVSSSSFFLQNIREYEGRYFEVGWSICLNHFFLRRKKSVLWMKVAIDN